MTRSTCMYYTGKDPCSGKEAFIPRSYADKKGHSNMLDIKI